MNTKKRLVCRNCGLVIEMSNESYQKVLDGAVYRDGMIPCLYCTDGAVYDVYTVYPNGEVYWANALPR